MISWTCSCKIKSCLGFNYVGIYSLNDRELSDVRESNIGPDDEGERWTSEPTQPRAAEMVRGFAIPTAVIIIIIIFIGLSKAPMAIIDQRATQNVK